MGAAGPIVGSIYATMIRNWASDIARTCHVYSDSSPDFEPDLVAHAHSPTCFEREARLKVLVGAGEARKSAAH